MELINDIEVADIAVEGLVDSFKKFVKNTRTNLHERAMVRADKNKAINTKKAVKIANSLNWAGYQASMIAKPASFIGDAIVDPMADLEVLGKDINTNLTKSLTLVTAIISEFIAKGTINRPKVAQLTKLASNTDNIFNNFANTYYANGTDESGEYRALNELLHNQGELVTAIEFASRRFDAFSYTSLKTITKENNKFSKRVDKAISTIAKNKNAKQKQKDASEILAIITNISDQSEMYGKLNVYYNNLFDFSVRLNAKLIKDN